MDTSRNNADHDINMPFTRVLAGPYGLSPGDSGLRRLRSIKHSSPGDGAQHTMPYAGDVCCYIKLPFTRIWLPAAYEGQPGFEFIQQVPTVWDERKCWTQKWDSTLLLPEEKTRIVCRKPSPITRQADHRSLRFFRGRKNIPLKLRDAPDADTDPITWLRKRDGISKRHPYFAIGFQRRRSDAFSIMYGKVEQRKPQI